MSRIKLIHEVSSTISIELKFTPISCCLGEKRRRNICIATRVDRKSHGRKFAQGLEYLARRIVPMARLGSSSMRTATFDWVFAMSTRTYPSMSMRLRYVCSLVRTCDRLNKSLLQSREIRSVEVHVARPTVNELHRKYEQNGGTYLEV